MTIQSIAVAAHIFSAVIYAVIIGYAAATLPKIKHAYNSETQVLLGVLLLLIIGLGSAFITSLALWFIDIGEGQAATMTNILWMAFNWMNAIAIILFITITRVFLLWRPVPCHDAPSGCPRLVELKLHQENIHDRKRRNYA